MNISVSDKRDFYGEVLSSALSNNTRIAYRKGWSCFEDYCLNREIDPFFRDAGGDRRFSDRAGDSSQSQERKNPLDRNNSFVPKRNKQKVR